MSRLLVKLLNKVKVLPFLYTSFSVYFKGKLIKIPVVGGMGYANLWLSEPWMETLLTAVYHPDQGLFMDVGANLGQTLIKLRLVHPTAKYLGFEPNPACVSYLRRLTEVNKFSDVTIIPAGLSDSSGLGVLQFYSQGNTDSSASMIDGFRPDQKVEKREFIPLSTWSELQGKIPDQQVAVVKIDVEGAELEVLESLKPCIQTYHPIILMEVLPSYSSENLLRVNRQDRIMDLLRVGEYVIYRVIKKEEKFIRLLQVDHFGIHGDLNLCEYVCVPLAKKATVTALEA